MVVIGDGDCGLSAHIARSKSKGYHVWMFFASKAVPSYKVRRVAKRILAEMDAPDTEEDPPMGSPWVPIGNWPLGGTQVLSSGGSASQGDTDTYARVIFAPYGNFGIGLDTGCTIILWV